MKPYMFGFLLAIISTGCSDEDEQATMYPSVWTAISLMSPDGGSKLVVNDNLTLSFMDAQQAVVQGVCNEGNAKYEITRSEIIFESIAMTEIACGENSALENEYISALFQVDRFTILNDTLTLTNRAGYEIMLVGSQNFSQKSAVCKEVPPNDEMCTAAFSRWFYFTASNTCEKISYSGCSQYGFATEEECLECKCK